MANFVRRWDSVELQSPVVTPEGFIRAQGIISRAGVFEYHTPKGVVREFRAPEEVTSPESLSSFALMPLTLNHPPDLLTPATVKQYQVGTIGKPEADGDLVKAEILITDASAIAAVKAGVNKISCGYRCATDPTPGVYTDPSGVEHKFDSRQKQIVGNHIALCRAPRAGDVAHIRLDSADGYTPGTIEGEIMEEVEVTVGGKTFKVAAEVAEALKQPRTDAAPDALKAEVATLKADLEKSQGRIAALEADAVSKLEATRVQARSDAQNEVLTERLELIAKSMNILGKPVSELVRMDVATIMREVVKKESPKVVIEGRTDDFVRGIFEHVTEKVDTSAALNQIVAGNKPVPSDRMDSASDYKSAGKEAYDKMVDRQRNAWKGKE